jgi:hypothetical protein
MCSHILYTEDLLTIKEGGLCVNSPWDGGSAKPLVQSGHATTTPVTKNSGQTHERENSCCNTLMLSSVDYNVWRLH